MPARVRPEEREPIHPKWVALGIVIVLVLGGTAVYVSARIVHARDLRSIRAYEQDVLPLLDRAASIHARMEQTESDLLTGRPRPRLARVVQSYRSDLQRIQRQLNRLATPSILEQSAAASYTGVAHSLRAVTALERQLAGPRRVPRALRAEFDTSWRDAATSFARGKHFLVRVRCRARVPDCARLPT